MALNRQSITVVLTSLNYSAPNNVEGDGSITGAVLWGNPSAPGETQFGNSIPYLIDKGFNTVDCANGTLPIQPVTAPAVKVAASLYKLGVAGLTTINLTGNDAGALPFLANDIDHYCFCPLAAGVDAATISLRIGPISDPINMDTAGLTVVHVASAPTNALVSLGTPFVAIDGTRGFAINILDLDTANTFFAFVDYAGTATTAVAAPLYAGHAAINSNGYWMPDYIDKTNRTMRVNLNGDQNLSFYTWNIDLSGPSITSAQIGTIAIADLTNDEQNIIFDATYGPISYMRGPVETSMTWGVCYANQDGTTNPFMIFSWDGTTITSLSYSGSPNWPDGRYTGIFGPASMLPNDSTQIEPPQLFPVIDGTTLPATHWFVRSPYVDPAGVGSGPWSFEAETWLVYASISAAPLSPYNPIIDTRGLPWRQLPFCSDNKVSQRSNKCLLYHLP